MRSSPQEIKQMRDMPSNLVFAAVSVSVIGTHFVGAIGKYEPEICNMVGMIWIVYMPGGLMDMQTVHSGLLLPVPLRYSLYVSELYIHEKYFFKKQLLMRQSILHPYMHAWQMHYFWVFSLKIANN